MRIGCLCDELQQLGATGYPLLPWTVEQMYAARDPAVRGEMYCP